MVGLTKGRFWLVKWIQGGHQTVEGSEILGSKSCERRSFVSDIDPSLRVGPDFSYLAVFELLLPATQKHVYIYIYSFLYIISSPKKQDDFPFPKEGYVGSLPCGFHVTSPVLGVMTRRSKLRLRRRRRDWIERDGYC